MTHVSGQEFCVMPRCGYEPHDLLEAPLCPKHALRVFAEMRDLTRNAREPAAVNFAPQKPPSRNTKNQEGFVYFMRFGRVIKIGFSVDVERRAKQLGADEILARIPGTRVLERTLHARFGPSWIDSEYYQPDPELLAYIAEIQQP